MSPGPNLEQDAEMIKMALRELLPVYAPELEKCLRENADCGGRCRDRILYQCVACSEDAQLTIVLLDDVPIVVVHSGSFVYVRGYRQTGAGIEKLADRQPDQKLAGLPDADKRVICDGVMAKCETPAERINAAIVLADEGLLPNKEAP